MSLFVSAVVSGIGIGFLYGIMGLSIALLYKSTGIISFAQPPLAMLLAFMGYRYISAGMPLYAAILAMVLTGALLGVLVYWLAFVPQEQHGIFNLILRSIALALIVEQAVVYLLSEGEPFLFPKMWEGGPITLAGINVPRQNLVIIVVTLVLLAALLVFFRHTRLGLLLRAVADSPGVVRLLGVNTRLLMTAAWAVSLIACAVVALLAAPISLVSSAMFAPYVLYAFTAFILGGISSWGGAIAGGIIVGVSSNVAVVYSGTEIAALITFAILGAILILKPAGLFGTSVRERL